VVKKSVGLSLRWAAAISRLFDAGNVALLASQTVFHFGHAIQALVVTGLNAFSGSPLL
jgi:hypothetical protein